jgi:diguanylate cyclase (GGDEF)-like protein
MDPLLQSELSGGMSLPTLTAISYPLLDLLLVAGVVGVAALQGRAMGRHWALLSAGLVVFAGSDVLYAYRVAQDTYTVGTPLDAGWAVGLSLIAAGVVASARRRTESGHRPARTFLAVPVLATTSALAVLIAGTQRHQSVLAIALAGTTVLAAAARTQFAVREQVRMGVLRRQAGTDDLTDLPNRRALYAEVQARLTGAPDRSHALLLLDLDRFKEVNDSLGHHIGDQLLVEAGKRLREQIREGDLLARLGGDEFAVLLPDSDEEQAVAVATKLRAALAEPFPAEGIALQSGVSVGVALFPQHGRDISALLRTADIAMYRAKRSHSGHHVYSGRDDVDGATRLRTLQELGGALAGKELVLHFQPKRDLASGRVCGVEALVRWQHPERGLLFPDAFLDLAEEAGLMRRLTEVVLELALDQAVLWRRKGLELSIAVNLSASSLMDVRLPEQVLGMLAERDLPARTLQLEITEEFLMADRERARSVLAELRSAGIHIAVDDFGTGYSSLAYLRDLPVDELKLDRSFVMPMADDSRAAALVASTIELAHSLGLRMVAEGVESDIAHDELTRLGCDQAQGYYISRPVPAAELEGWIATQSSAVALSR